MKSKTQIVLLHGALGTHAQLDAIAERLRAAGHDVFNILLPGHGNCALNGQFSPEYFAAFVRDEMLALGIRNATLFGYSMGGYAGALLALENPELVSRLVTLGTKWHWSPDIAERETKMLNPSVMQEKVPHYAAKLAHLHGVDGWKVLLERTAAMMRTLGETNPLNPARLASIKMPVTVLLGDSDQMVTREESETAARAMSNGRFVLLPNTPHPIEKAPLDTMVSAILE